MPTKKRLVTIGHSYVVGLNRRLGHELCRAAPPGWDVTMVAPKSFHGDLGPIQFASENDEPCEVISVAARNSKYIHLMNYGRELKELLSPGWGLVHCWEEPFVYSASQIVRWSKDSPVVLYSFQNIPKTYPLPFSWMERSNMKAAAGWIAAGQTVSDALCTRENYHNRPSCIIPLGVDLKHFQPNRDQGIKVRQSLGWDSAGPPIVGFLGRFIEEKGLSLIMDSLDACQTPWRALFVGGGVMQSKLNRWSATHPGKVRIVNNVKHHEVPSYLNAMDILLAPSQTRRHWREQLGRMIIEAFACGVPVVGSDSGEIPHVIMSAGEILPEKDVKAWTAKIEELLESPVRRRELSEAGTHRARSTFAWPVIAKQHWDFFEVVLDQSKRIGDKATKPVDGLLFESEFLPENTIAASSDVKPKTLHFARKQPRRLLTIAHSYVLRVNRVLANEFQNQSNGQWEVTAVAPTFFKGRNDIRPLVMDVPQNESSRVVGIRCKFTDRIHIFHYARELRPIIRSGFDLVHAWEEPYIAVGLQLALWTPKNVPLVFRTAQSLDKRYVPPFNLIERYCVDRMSGWIFSGSLVEKNLLSRPGYGNKPRHRAPLGFDPNALFVDRASGLEIRRRLGWDDTTPVVGYLGRFVKDKGLSVLMDALDLIKQPWNAIFVGNGPMLNELKDWATKHSKSVAICSDVAHADVNPYINSMDMLVAPSLTMPNWREQFGRMIVEGFACGVPVIGSDSGEIPHVIRDSGIVVPENNAVALSDAVQRLMNDRALCKEFAGRGMDRAHTEYTWARIARSTLDFFEQLLEK